MPGDSRLSARFGADTNDFKSGITEINRELKLIETGFKATASTMDDWSNNATGLDARMKALTQEISLQSEKVDALRIRHEQMAQANGANSVEAQNAQIEFNKESEKLGKLQTEANQTGNSLKTLETKTGGVRGAFKDFGTQLDALKQQFPQLGAAISLLTNPISLAIAGLGAFIKLTKESVGESVAYNKSIREMMELTGLSADETSRLVQVADDMGISMQNAQSALELMNKKGYKPSIDNLAQIADEYVNAADKTTFLEEASKKYGKSFGDLIPMLVKGGAALRDASAGIENSLIVTDRAIEESRKYEVAVDKLNDAWTGFKHTIGNEAIPIMADALTEFNKATDAIKYGKQIKEDYNAAVKQGLVTEEIHAQALAKAERESNGLNTASLTMLETLKLLREDGYVPLDKGERDLITTTVTAASDFEIFAGSTRKVQSSAEELAKIHTAEYLDGIAKAAKAVTTSFDNLNSTLDGQLGPNLQDFNDKQDKLTTKMGENQTAIDKLNGMDYLTPEQQNELDGLKTDQQNLQTEYGKNATEYDKATHKIMFDMLEQKMAADGLTSSEVTFLQNLAVAWDLPDQATLNYQANMAAAMTWFSDHPTDTAGMMAILAGTATAWSLIQQNAANAKQEVANYIAEIAAIKDHVTTITTNFVENRLTHQEQTQYQHGANFIVPTGYDNDTFRMNVSSGEHVIVIPTAQRFGNSMASSGGVTSGVSGQMQSAMAPINITIQGVPEKEMDMRRLARYVATEIQRRQ